MEKSKKKKEIKSATYVKGTEALDKAQMALLVKHADSVFVQRQSIYDDGTESVTLQVHFNPKTINSKNKENESS